MALPLLVFLPAVTMATALVGSVAVYYGYPKLLAKSILRLQLFSCGMKVKTVSQSSYTFSYAERGQHVPGRPSLLFIHGFTSSKEAWCEVVRYLPKEVHVVSVDLLGHGSSSVPPENDVLHAMGQAHKVYQFAKLIGLDKQPFHVIGQSMGGAISGCFAAAYPEMVSHVTFVCPAMLTPEASKFSNQIIQGKNRLVPDSVEEMQETLQLISHRPLPSNRQVMKGMLEMRKEKKAYFERVFNELSQPEAMNLLMKNAGSIKAASQIVWGEQDHVVDISGMEVLKAELKTCLRADRVNNCGHVVNMERPRVLGKLILALQEDAKTMSQPEKLAAKI